MHSGLVELSWSTYPTVAGERRERLQREGRGYKAARGIQVQEEYKQMTTLLQYRTLL